MAHGHRDMDRAIQLDRMIAALDVAIADEKAAEITDLRTYAELRRKRKLLETQRQDLEIELTCI